MKSACVVRSQPRPRGLPIRGRRRLRKNLLCQIAGSEAARGGGAPSSTFVEAIDARSVIGIRDFRRISPAEIRATAGMTNMIANLARHRDALKASKRQRKGRPSLSRCERGGRGEARMEGGRCVAARRPHLSRHQVGRQVGHQVGHDILQPVSSSLPATSRPLATSVTLNRSSGSSVPFACALPT